MTGTDPVVDDLVGGLGPDAVTTGDAISADDCHDESLQPRVTRPAASCGHARPPTWSRRRSVRRGDASRSCRGARAPGCPAARPRTADGVVVAFDAMAADEGGRRGQPGRGRRARRHASGPRRRARPVGLRYPVYPGELSGSLGGNVNTNAGGMRAVRHGVTRNHVLGLELVLADGTVVRTGGKVMKSSSGYDLTQLVVGSEGTLALVTEVTLRLSPALGIRPRSSSRAPTSRRSRRGPPAPRRGPRPVDPRVPRRFDHGRDLSGRGARVRRARRGGRQGRGVARRPARAAHGAGARRGHRGHRDAARRPRRARRVRPPGSLGEGAHRGTRARLLRGQGCRRRRDRRRRRPARRRRGLPGHGRDDRRRPRRVLSGLRPRR